ncbi:hypothetical protein AKG39_18750 [Acetobacterium bakii]|uniref:Uncharacterized protein n=1 Tax=Acetobacterium bakii TaxID=52689 RepID=A0A0L6TVZ7_9FIRM|nr:hypothetical protein AKG39_18750 [Acetobacterium bakii]
MLDASNKQLAGYSVQYSGHVQDIGDVAMVADGSKLGTVGASQRLECLSVGIVKVADFVPYYRALGAAEEIIATKDDYTPASVAALEKAVHDNPVPDSPTQAQVDAAAQAINEALANVIKLTKITTISVINPTTAIVQFNNQVVDLDKSVISVSNKDGDEQDIKLIELANDGLSAAVIFNTPLVEGTTYTMSIPFLTNITIGSFDYAVSEVRSIEAATPQIVVADQATAIDYKVYDFDGMDITSLVQDKITFESTVTVTADGKITLPAKTTGVVTVVYTNGDVVVKSPQISVSTEALPVITQISNTLTVDLADEYDTYTLREVLARAFKATLGEKTPDVFVESYVSDNESVTSGELNPGTATIVIPGVTVTGINVAGPYTLTLKVTDTTNYVALRPALYAINAGAHKNTATVANYTDAGITGVTAANLTDVNAQVTADEIAKLGSLTKSQIQLSVNKILEI